jgi:DNA-binding NtrC family response regulator
VTVSAATLPKVLCVDDEPGLLRSLRWLLRGEYQVAVATSGMDALALLGGDTFDVIISDQRMPGMTGTEFLEQAKRISPRSVRLLLTGYSDFNAVLSSVNDGEVFRFLSKPWDNQKLLETVGEAARVARLTPACVMDEQDPPNAEVLESFDETVLVFDSAGDDSHTQWQTATQGTTRLICTDEIGTAVLHLTQQKIAVLVTDVQRGRSQQMELIRALRRSRPEVVVVVYSQERDSAVIGRLINEGQIYRFIARPAGPEYLNRVLRSALTRHRQLVAVPERTTRLQTQVSDDSDFELACAAAAGQLPASVRTPLTGARAWLQRLFR